MSGDIRMVLHGGKATVTGRQSDVSLYDFNLATYDEGDTFDQSQARGFIEIYGMSSTLAARRDAGLPLRCALSLTKGTDTPVGSGAAGSPAVRRRRCSRSAGRPTSTGGWRRTTSPARGPTPAPCTGPVC